MTSLETALRRACAELTAARVPFALVGGLAVSVRTEPRFTRDADLAVALETDASAEALVHLLGSRGFAVHAVVEQEATGRLATVRLTTSPEPMAPVVDLLFASSGIESEVVADAEPLEILPHLTVRVARTGHLIALKVLARDDEARPQDILDLRILLRTASPQEVTRARGAIGLITARGYHRGKDLSSALNRLLGSAG